MLDTFDREINYMRISVTDRCNLRCRYCMPNGIQTVPMDEVLTYEELTEVARAAVTCGITRFKVTGGEPLARIGVAEFIRSLKAVEGCEQVTLTTNGVLLASHLRELTDAGLDAVNVSLDTLHPVRYAALTGRDALSQVLASINAAYDFGLKVKINVVPIEGVNEEDWVKLAYFAVDRPIDVRFIELMPIGGGAAYRGVSNVTVYEKIEAAYPDIRMDLSGHGNGPARYVKPAGFQGSIGFISAMHGKFCASCNRLRLTATGQLKPCLCYADSIDLKAILRGTDDPAQRNVTDEKARGELLADALRRAIGLKPEGHSFEDKERITETKNMSHIGG